MLANGLFVLSLLPLMSIQATGQAAPVVGVAELTSEPDQFMNRVVSVEGEVARTFSDKLYVLRPSGSPAGAETALLVLVPGAAGTPSGRMTLTGTVRAFNRQELEERYGPLEVNAADLSAFEGRPILIGAVSASGRPDAPPGTVTAPTEPPWKPAPPSTGPPLEPPATPPQRAPQPTAPQVTPPRAPGTPSATPPGRTVPPPTGTAGMTVHSAVSTVVIEPQFFYGKAVRFEQAAIEDFMNPYFFTIDDGEVRGRQGDLLVFAPETARVPPKGTVVVVEGEVRQFLPAMLEAEFETFELAAADVNVRRLQGRPVLVVRSMQLPSGTSLIGPAR